MRILMMCLLVLSSFVYSDGHTSEEKEVLAAVKNFMMQEMPEISQLLYQWKVELEFTARCPMVVFINQ